MIKAYVWPKIFEKTQYVLKNISESQYKTMDAIWSLEIHHSFP